MTNDRVSILVPNSKLLEEEVVSWSHGDPRCRITVGESALELEVWTLEPRHQEEIVSDLNFAIEQRHFCPEELAAARAALSAASPADEDADLRFVHEAGRGTWSAEELRALVERMRNAADLPILDRRHRLRSYARCFVGREAVDWLVRHQGITRERAVAVGRLLVEHDLLHHVLDEHTFHDDGFFYRFRADD